MNRRVPDPFFGKKKQCRPHKLTLFPLAQTIQGTSLSLEVSDQKFPPSTTHSKCLKGIKDITETDFLALVYITIFGKARVRWPPNISIVGP